MNIGHVHQSGLDSPFHHDQYPYCCLYTGAAVGAPWAAGEKVQL